MLKDILEAAKLDPQFCATLLSVSTEQFKEWVHGSPIPSYIIPELSAVLGVPEEVLTDVRPATMTDGMITPAVWFKMRDQKLSGADRELVGVVRKMGYFLSQLTRADGQTIAYAKNRVDEILSAVDKSAPPAIQGKIAAQAWRRVTELDQYQQGIGELARPLLRRIGVLIVESPLPQSPVEGCSFRVGSGDEDHPCIFANSFKSTWFRRNGVLLHEFAHVIFDLENDQVAVDYRDIKRTAFEEIRADAFAMEALASEPVLIQIANRYGLKWDALSARDLAQIVADSHAEQRLVLKAAGAYGLISDDHWIDYTAYACEQELKLLSPHALNTKEFIRTLQEVPTWVAENRQARIGKVSVMLPVNYVSRVLSAFDSKRISRGKAIEMLMIDDDLFQTRFARS